MSIRYRVDLIGTTWEGRQAVYSYEFPDERPSAKQIRKKAGDFQDVTDYRVTCIIHTGDYESETTTRKVVDDWKREESADVWQECMA